MGKIMNRWISALFAFLLSQSIGATVIDWTWTGDGGYKASGTFSYADSLNGTGVITASSIDSFHLEAWTGASSMFAWDLTDGTSDGYFQFSFDTSTLDIVKGGVYPTALNSVSWGYNQTVGRLVCGTGACGLFYNQSLLGARDVLDAQFTFSQARSSIPEPAMLSLLGLGFALIGLSRNGKTRLSRHRH